jgi:hypothetical protein
MSYVLQRLKIAEIGRFIAETLPNNPSEATYGAILSLDLKFEQFLEQLPIFFQTQHSHSAEVDIIDEKHPYISMQRLSKSMLLNLVRCNLHFSYLVGCPNQDSHGFS